MQASYDVISVPTCSPDDACPLAHRAVFDSGPGIPAEHSRRHPFLLQPKEAVLRLSQRGSLVETIGVVALWVVAVRIPSTVFFSSVCACSISAAILSTPMASSCTLASRESNRWFCEIATCVSVRVKETPI